MHFCLPFLTPTADGCLMYGFYPYARWKSYVPLIIIIFFFIILTAYGNLLQRQSARSCESVAQRKILRKTWRPAGS